MKAENQKRFFETILSSVADGVFTVGQDWRITSFNAAASASAAPPSGAS
jgi:nitrogen fixation/metabolism regulation signal transduction histidine kinase